MKSGPALLLLLGCVLALGHAQPGTAQGAAQGAAALPPTLTWSTDAAEPARFVAVHGERSLIMGYPADGLEVWTYPLQLVRDYQVAFLPLNSTRILPGASLLRRVEYLPNEVVRVYVGPDFVVREHLFVPLHTPGAILRYEVQGRGKIAIRVHFIPTLNLMWPGALGGQSVQWNDRASGYIISEPLYGYSATIASPQVTAHDDEVNRTISEGTGDALVLRPAPAAGGARQAEVFIGLDAPHAPPGAAPGAATVPLLEKQEAALEAEATEHTRHLLDASLQITTPDAEINRALAWAVLALDQAWVCNPELGCGEVAGYGPSRPGRRPQYAWFFAGDGLVATDALLAAGEYDRARDELAFIARYQNAKNGMIWHEMSQSAALIDWQNRYPYMFVHVDITFQYLAALAQYAAITGDTQFVQQHWPGIQAAYRYCRSLIDAGTGLPQIPPGKEGANEQDRMRDDIGLSSEWIAAADAYAELAHRMKDSRAATEAGQAADKARRSVAAEDWDPARHFWVAGHTVAGKAVFDQRPNPSGILQQGVFTHQQAGQVLDQIASARFQTDWGTRSMSSASPDFDPDSYSKGSVSALASSTIATTFWLEHRPVTAGQIWSALAPWNRLDAMGHMHEVLAGDLYHPQVESVPEQTWSSAGFLSAAVHGLLGISVDGSARTLTFAPDLPPDWHELTLANLRVHTSLLHLHLQQNDGAITLEVENSGEAVALSFAPRLPLGASVSSAEVNGHAAHASVETFPQDEHAGLSLFAAAHATTRCRIVYTGGVAIIVPRPAPQIGDASRGLKVQGIQYADRTLTIDADMLPAGDDTLTLVTAWTPAAAQGATVQAAGPGRYTLRFTAASTAAQQYAPAHAVVRFQQP